MSSIALIMCVHVRACVCVCVCMRVCMHVLCRVHVCVCGMFVPPYDQLTCSLSSVCVECFIYSIFVLLYILFLLFSFVPDCYGILWRRVFFFSPVVPPICTFLSQITPDEG